MGKFDIACGILSLVGLLLWYLTKIGNIATIFSIFSDFMAGVPTLIKAYKYPETENWIEYSSACVSAVITLFTIKIWNFEYFTFPLYIFLFDFTGILFIKFKLKKLLSYGKYSAS